MERLRWVLTAVLSAVACQLAVVHATPIDRALPLLGIVATLLAWASYTEVMLAVPLLVVAELAIADEETRLLALGAVMAAAIVLPLPGKRAAAAAVAAVVLLRWIPTPEQLGREVFLLLVALAIFAVLGRTPFAAAVAIVTALATPAVPLRTLALPLLVLAVAIAARTFAMPRVRLAWPAAVVIAFAVLFFPWSGIVARGFPYFLKRVHPAPAREFVMTVPPGQSAMVDVPEGKTTLVVSGANVAHLGRGVRIGSIDPGHVPVAIGDVADWGYMRRAQYYGSHNPLPRDPAGTIRGYGYDAWIDGAGRIALPAAVRRIRVTAEGGALQVEGFE